MTHKRNARAPRPDPAAQDPMDYLLGDVTSAVDQITAELREMENLQADPVATLAGHCANLAGRVAALVEVVRQMRDLQRGLVVISDPPMPAPRLITEDQALAAQQRAQAERTLVRWRMGADGLEPVYADQDLATDEQIRAANLEDDLAASRPRRWTRAEALAEAERLGGMGGAIFLMHWENSSGGA